MKLQLLEDKVNLPPYALLCSWLSIQFKESDPVHPHLKLDTFVSKQA